MLKDKLAAAAASITILVFLYTGFNKLATKQDIQRVVIISSFNYNEASIKINELKLENLDKIKLERALNASEQRQYNAIEASTIRITQAQEKLLDLQNYIN